MEAVSSSIDLVDFFSENESEKETNCLHNNSKVWNVRSVKSAMKKDIYELEV